MENLTAVVLGATGLVGEQLVQHLLADPAFSKVRILVRRPFELAHQKLEVEIVNFDNLTEIRQKLGVGDCLFCCIGTTNKKVNGDKAAYRKVDYDIAVNAAKISKDVGFRNYLLVSSVGANVNSTNFYLHLKGEVEEAIVALNLPSFHIFRPGILLGKRKEFRIGEAFGRVLMQSISLLLAGNLNKYKGIKGATVAGAMVAAAKITKEGIFIHYNNQINELATCN